MHTGYDSNSSPARAVVAKISTTGAQVWVRAFSTSGTQEEVQVLLLMSNNVYWKITNDFGDPNATGDNVFFDMTTNGTVTWAKTLTSLAWTMVRPDRIIAVDDDGNVYFGGSVGTTGDNEDTAVYGKLNSSGVVQYCRKIGPVTNGRVSIKKFLHDQDQSIVFSGTCSDSNGYNGAYVGAFA